MSTKETRFEIYKECFEDLPINQGELARLLSLGELVTKSVRNKVSDKLNQTPNKGITKSEAFAIQAIKLLHLIYEKKGLHIGDITFDSSGRIKQEYTENVLKTLFPEDVPEI